MREQAQKMSEILALGRRHTMFPFCNVQNLAWVAFGSFWLHRLMHALQELSRKFVFYLIIALCKLQLLWVNRYLGKNLFPILILHATMNEVTALLNFLSENYNSRDYSGLLIVTTRKFATDLILSYFFNTAANQITQSKLTPDKSYTATDKLKHYRVSFKDWERDALSNLIKALSFDDEENNRTKLDQNECKRWT